MNLYHLRYFVTLAQVEHYTKASEILEITQPSLSYAINSLENELGIKLFEKVGRNIALTSYGKILYESVSEILAKLDATIDHLHMASEGEGTISVAFLRSIGVRYLPKVIKNYKAEHSDKNVHFKLHCNESTAEGLLQGLKARAYDIAFCNKSDLETNIEFTKIIDYDLVLIVPLDHPLAIRDEIELKDTLDYDYFFFKDGILRQQIDRLFEESGIYPNCLAEIDVDQVIAGFVANGFAISVVPDIPILNTLPLKKIKIKSPYNINSLYMATLKNVYHPPIVEDFIRYVKDYVPDL